MIRAASFLFSMFEQDFKKRVILLINDSSYFKNICINHVYNNNEFGIAACDFLREKNNSRSNIPRLKEECLLFRLTHCDAFSEF